MSYRCHRSKQSNIDKSVLDSRILIDGKLIKQVLSKFGTRQGLGIHALATSRNDRNKLYSILFQALNVFRQSVESVRCVNEIKLSFHHINIPTPYWMSFVGESFCWVLGQTDSKLVVHNILTYTYINVTNLWNVRISRALDRDKVDAFDGVVCNNPIDMAGTRRPSTRWNVLATKKQPRDISISISIH
jgi:hypothetical protein